MIHQSLEQQEAGLSGNNGAVQLASAMIAFRSDRRMMLPSEIFNEPAQDLLLTLFVADATGHRLTASLVCKKLNMLKLIMARWLKHLSKSGLVVGDGHGDIDDLLTSSAVAMGKSERLMLSARVFRDQLK